MDEPNKGVIRIVDVRKRLAPDFLRTFNSLLNVMVSQEIKERAKLIKEVSQTITNKRINHWPVSIRP